MQNQDVALIIASNKFQLAYSIKYFNLYCIWIKNETFHYFNTFKVLHSIECLKILLNPILDLINFKPGQQGLINATHLTVLILPWRLKVWVHHCFQHHCLNLPLSLLRSTPSEHTINSTNNMMLVCLSAIPLIESAAEPHPRLHCPNLHQRIPKYFPQLQQHHCYYII